MAASRVFGLVGTSLLLFVLAATAGPARGDVIGTNQFLTESHGKFYIPLAPADSGDLGDQYAPHKYVGRTADSATLTGPSGSASGHVRILLNFSLGDTLLNPNSAALTLTFFDLDFKPTIAPAYTYSETALVEVMSSTMEESAGEPSSMVDAAAGELLIDDVNYGVFRPDGAGPCNNVTVTYTMALATDLGMTQADFDAANASGQLQMAVTFTSHLTGTSGGRQLLNNTAESLPSAKLIAIGIPEPATLALIGLGSPVVIRRHRR